MLKTEIDRENVHLFNRNVQLAKEIGQLRKDKVQMVEDLHKADYSIQETQGNLTNAYRQIDALKEELGTYQMQIQVATAVAVRE